MSKRVSSSAFSVYTMYTRKQNRILGTQWDIRDTRVRRNHWEERLQAELPSLCLYVGSSRSVNFFAPKNSELTVPQLFLTVNVIKLRDTLRW